MPGPRSSIRGNLDEENSSYELGTRYYNVQKAFSAAATVFPQILTTSLWAVTSEAEGLLIQKMLVTLTHLGY